MAGARALSWRAAGTRAGLAVRKSHRAVQTITTQHPLISKAIPTAFGFAFGDFLTQYLNRDRQQPYSHNFRSTALMAAAGAAVAAPAGLLLCQWMDAVWPSPLLIAAAGKFTIDQVVGCALWQAFYCAIPGNEGYRDALAAGLQRAAAGADDGVRTAVVHAAAAASLVLPVPAAP